MPEENNNNPMPRRRISIGFILSIVLVVGLIAILIWRIFGNVDNSTHLTPRQYVQALYNDKVESASVTLHYGSNKLEITGTYVNDNNSKEAYTVITDLSTYENNAITYYYTFEGAETSVTASLNTIMNQNLATKGINVNDIYETTW